MISIGCTAAGAVESGPAVVTFLTSVDIALAEVFLDIVVGDTIPNIAHKVFFVAYKLVARIKIAPWSDSKILCTGTTACDSLVDARPVGQVEHIVIEGYWMTFFFSFQHFLGKDFILAVKHRQILLGEGVRVIRTAHNRFHRKLGEAQVSKMENVLGKICVCMSIGAAYIIVAVTAISNICGTCTYAGKFLELRNDNIVAAISLIVLSQTVMHFFSAVNAHDHVVAFLVCKFDNFVVNSYAVGSQGKSEVLSFFLFYAA